jgi:TctA family transporter
VLANVIAVIMFLAIARWVGLLTFVRGGLLVPLIFVFAITGSYLSSGNWKSLIVLLLFGFLGYGLKRLDWPRPPFVIGLVLGGIAEVSLHKALAIWGLAFLLRPPSLILLAMIGASILFYVWRRRTLRTDDGG